MGAASLGMSEEEYEEVMKVVRMNQMRNAEIRKTFNPITGEGSIGKRKKVCIEGMGLDEQWIPVEMLEEVPLVQQLVEVGSVKAYLRVLYAEMDGTEVNTSGTVAGPSRGRGRHGVRSEEEIEEDRQKLIEEWVRVRVRYDFAFWAAMYVYIKAKGGGEDICLVLNRPQRRLIEAYERERKAGMPIRLILLKARQWGGSTATQMYMAWLQLVHKVGLNSLIVAHVKDTAIEVMDMFSKLINSYPTELLYEMGEAYKDNEPKLVSVGQTTNIKRVPQRNCKIKICTAVEPDSCRGGDYNLVHCTEVGLWKKTDGKSPQKIVRSACSGVLMRPYTMIVYESTANGTGNFFHK